MLSPVAYFNYFLNFYCDEQQARVIEAKMAVAKAKGKTQ
jgi:hypothetical protein